MGYAFKQKKHLSNTSVNPMLNIVLYDAAYDFMEIFFKKRHRTRTLKQEQNELEYVIFDFSF